MTHAGVHQYLINEYISRNRNISDRYIMNGSSQRYGQDIVDKVVKPATEEALNRVSNGFEDPWLSAGFARGGVQSVGGIIWLDWVREFTPVSGLNQIVGHTTSVVPTEKSIQSSKNYDLDTMSKHIGILENGTFSCIENSYL